MVSIFRADRDVIDSLGDGFDYKGDDDSLVHSG